PSTSILFPYTTLFRSEFLNRIDEVIIFQRLEVAQLSQITELMLETSRRRLHAQNIAVEFTPAAVEWLARHGYEPEFGARPMRRLDRKSTRLNSSHQII